MTSEAAGASKRHDDHSAVGSLVERPVRPAAEARWYCLDRDGVAMLCKDEADARAQVVENDDCWPGRAPHRAVLLGDVAAAESCAADAERYRWVKRVRPGALLTVAWGESKFACAIADDPDAAIDAAMADAPAVGAA